MENLAPSKYLELSEFWQRYLAGKAPLLLRAVAGKSYLLPTDLQGLYAKQSLSQAAFIHEYFNFLMRGVAVSADKDVTDRAEIKCYRSLPHLRAVEFERPTFFLDPDFGEALLRTDAPLDLDPTDIHWAFPQLRFYLPLGLLQFSCNGRSAPVIFIDLARFEEKATYSLPESYREEWVGAALPSCSVMHTREAGFCISAQLPWVEERGLGFTRVTGWGGPLRNVLGAANERPWWGREDSRLSAQALLDLVTGLACNLLLYFGALPSDVQNELSVPASVIRKSRLEGKRIKPGLSRAKIIGAEYPRQPSSLDSSFPTGRHQIAHWKRGHWRRQPCGSGNLQRKNIWIRPYRAGRNDDTELAEKPLLQE